MIGMYGGTREPIPIDQRTTGELWLAIALFSALGMGIIAAALFFLFLVVVSLLFLLEQGAGRVAPILALLGSLLGFVVWAYGAISLSKMVLAIGKELRRRKKSDQSRI